MCYNDYTMDERTLHRLNQINRVFYARVGAHYDASRRYVREGWRAALDLIRERAAARGEFRALDVGCGNGWFGKFLIDQLPIPVLYHGIDADAYLLGQAERNLAAARAVFALIDLIAEPDPFRQLAPVYHLVVFNNVLHHIPSFELRRRLLLAAAEKLAEGGLLLFTAWQFLKQAKWQARVIPWTACPDVDPSQLEPGDYLLDWRRGARAVRYCHFMDDAELDALVQALNTGGLVIVTAFLADGKTDDLNRYVIAQKAG